MSKKVLQGRIVSDKMQKTVVVAVLTVKKHAIYSKVIETTKKVKARNEINAKLNDLVLVEESRPFSKDVCWIVKEVVTKE